MDENEISKIIIGAAIEVHRTLGPGLLESFYEACLVVELRSRGMMVEQQKEVKGVYKGIKFGTAYRVDLLVNNKVIIEVKSSEYVHPIYESQLLSYLRISDIKLGLLERISEGIC